jgi:hypothetical protein
MHSRIEAFVDARRSDEIVSGLIECTRVPAAQFRITGLIGPKANAHGPNECLHVPCAKKLTAYVALVLATHVRRAP